MFAAWLLPRFVLQALKAPQRETVAALESVPGGTPSQMENTRLVCVTEAAERAGARAGMTVSQAQARCPGLRLLYRDEQAEQGFQAALLESAESWTPNYEATQPGLCVLDLRHVRWNNAGGWLERGLQMRQDVCIGGHDLRVGMAGNADLAVLAAHLADPVRVIRAGVTEEKSALQELPISVLTPAAQVQEVLLLWGVQTLGELAALPKADIASRLGKEGLHLWTLAQGGKDRLLQLVRPHQEFREEMELESPIESLGPLMHLLERMLQRLCTRLAADWRVAGTLHMILKFDDRTDHRRELRVAEPTRDISVLLRLLETYLEGLKAAAPIVYAALEITPVRAASSQSTLFDRGLRDPNRFAETLSALEALLGRGHVGRVEMLPTRRPDAFRVVNFLESATASKTVSPPAFQGLPLQRFRPARAVQVILKESFPALLRLDGQTRPLVSCSGPWLLSGGWWDLQQSWEQEMWDAAGEDGTLYCLVSQKGRWSVEGIYG